MRTYCAETGLLNVITAETGSGPGNIGNLSYTRDPFGNPWNRTNTSENFDENICYDAWGKRRKAVGSDIVGCTQQHPSSYTLRGYWAAAGFLNWDGVPTTEPGGINWGKLGGYMA